MQGHAGDIVRRLQKEVLYYLFYAVYCKSNTLEDYLQNIVVEAMQQFTLERQAATEWLSAYEGMFPELGAIIDHFTMGPCLVLKVRSH